MNFLEVELLVFWVLDSNYEASCDLWIQEFLESKSFCFVSDNLGDGHESLVLSLFALFEVLFKSLLH